MCNSFTFTTMFLPPSVRVSANTTLQRSYFTSELFVSAARADVDGLLSSFEHLAEEEPEPYAVFKRVWIKEGWNYSNLLIWEDTARVEYIHTMFRLFSGEQISWLFTQGFSTS